MTGTLQEMTLGTAGSRSTKQPRPSHNPERQYECQIVFRLSSPISHETVLMQRKYFAAASLAIGDSNVGISTYLAKVTTRTLDTDLVKWEA